MPHLSKAEKTAKVSATEASRRRAVALAHYHELRVGQLEGRLVEGATIQAEVHKRFEADAESLQNGPSRYTPELAHSFEIPQRTMRSILDRFVRLHRLERSSITAANLAAMKPNK